MNLRPSTETRIESNVLRLINLIVGTVLLVGGSLGARAVLERGDPGHADHPLIYLFSGIALLGALMLPGIFGAIQPVLVFIIPYIPMLGGRRKEDPPEP